MNTQRILEITQIRSTLRCERGQIQTMKALGFRRMNQTVRKPQNQAIDGMVRKIAHLVRVKIV